MKNNVVLAAVVASLTLGPVASFARSGAQTAFWSNLDRNGVLSAGWVQVLPDLASACNLRIDSRELNARLVDLSETSGNGSYAADLYWHLYLMDRGKAKNAFVNAWKARFAGNQKAACTLAEILWGNEGHQFPGVLRREVALDTTPTGAVPQDGAPDFPPNAAAPSNCR